jgi:hypothetical protein
MQSPHRYHATAREAARYFAVRIKVARDQLGRDRQYDDMCCWLDASTGPNR